MDLSNPQDWAQGVGAFKAALDALSTVFKLVKENRSGGKSSPEDEALVDRALAEADRASKVAEAQLLSSMQSWQLSTFSA